MQRKQSLSKIRGKSSTGLASGATPSRFDEFCQSIERRTPLFFRIFPQARGKWDLKLWGCVFLFSLVLSWMLTLDLESLTNLKVGEAAPQTVISPFSFEMIDQVSTEEKRARAESSVPPIFDFDPQAFDLVSNRVYRAFRILRSQFREVNWPKGEAAREERIKDFMGHKNEFEKELGVELSEYLYEWILRQELSAHLENAVIKNLDAIYSKKLADAVDRTVPFDAPQILVRSLYHQNNKEFYLKKSDLINLSDPDSITLAFDGHLLVKDQKNLLQLVRALLIPNVTPNRQEMESRRAKLRETILPISVSVKKNQLIVNEGNTVQPQQYSIVQHIETLKKQRSSPSVLMSLSFLFFFLILILFVFVKQNFRAKMHTSDLWALGAATLLTIVLFKVFLFLTQTSLLTRFGSWIPSEVFFYAAPVAVGAMLAGLLFPAREIVFLFTAFLSFVLGVATEFNFQYMVVCFIGGLVAARSVAQVRTRSDLYAAGFKTGIINSVIVALLVTASKAGHDLFWTELGWSIPAGLIGGVLSSFLALVFVSFFESVFHFATNIKLLELSNLNHPLLREMIVKAPGTYHHSMMVGSMVEAAAEEIEANPLLAKVMAYYHDIGKIEHANYFIENQKPGQNPHDHISPYMSKTLLVSHMKDGMDLAKKYKLGTQIAGGIVQHHGTTVIAFFYNRARDQAQNPDAVLEGEFRYPGPKPQFREAALIMLADSIEAAARSLDDPTPQRLQHIVRAVVQRKFMDGQLDECNISMKDLGKIENSFARILLGIYHQRIDYPKTGS